MHSVHTMMTNLTKLRIHVAPVGFEIDRIVLPAKEMKADKVYLIHEENPTKEKAGLFIEKISEKLKEFKIDYQLVGADRTDLFKIIKSIKEIIENEKDNDVYVNVSSGSKIQAIASMMACMMFLEYDATPYYAEPKKYAQPTIIKSSKLKPQSSGLKSIWDLPKYEMKKPGKKLVDALNLIKMKGGKITKKEMAKKAADDNLINVNAKKENLSQARLASLDVNIVRPLKEWDFVKVEKIGRNHWIKITEKGDKTAEFLTSNVIKRKKILLDSIKDQF